MAIKKLPKQNKIKELEKQDKELASLPTPEKEKKILKRAGSYLKHLVRPRKVEAQVKKIKKEEKKAVKQIEKEEAKEKEKAKKTKKKSAKKKKV